ncbi:MAG: hypothetical protein ACOCQW_05180 [Halanaerobiaceae bacterium]
MEFIKSILITVLISLVIGGFFYLLLVKPLSLREKFQNKFYQGHDNKKVRYFLSLMVIAILAAVLTELLGSIQFIDEFFNSYPDIADGVRMGFLLTGFSIIFLNIKKEN